MPQRTTIQEVRDVLPVTSLTDTQIQAAINAATCAVDQIVLGCASGLSEATLIQVETYLAAHYCAILDNTLSLSSETDACSGSTVNYSFKFGEGVLSTAYGQAANALSGGCLVELSKQPPNIFSIGSA